MKSEKKVKSEKQIKQRFKLVDFIQNRQKKAKEENKTFWLSDLGYGNWYP